jgi:plasmid stabilization system protein ParE
MQLVVMPKVERDLELIGDYIAQDNPCRAIDFP